MNTTELTEEQTSLVLSEFERKNRTLVTPSISPEVRNILLEQGWNLLLSWLADKAPENIQRLARGLNFMDWYSRECQDHNGQVPEDINEGAAERVLDLVNTMAGLNWI